MYKSLVIICLLFAWSTMYAQEEKTITEVERPDYWKLPGKSSFLKFGGYVKLDIIHDFDPIGSEDYFDPTTIPTDGSEGERTHFNAKETRLYFDSRTDTKYGEAQVYVEGDFYGDGSSFRMRHAYANFNDKWLAGFTWSNFMDVSIIPATLDFEKPAAYAFRRNAMLRWKQKLSNKSFIAIALDEANSTGQQPAEAGQYENPYPDATLKYRIEGDVGHIQLAGFGGLLRYRYDSTQLGTTDISLYGVNFSGKLNFLKRDYLTFQVIYGPGVGRFRSGNSASLDEDGNIVAQTDMGLTFGLRHGWTDKLSTLLVYNHGLIDDSGGRLPSDESEVSYAAANLLYQVDKNTMIGVEYLRGNRIDVSEDDGYANRIQFSVKYVFN